MRQLNFSSFGTQLVAPGGGVPPPPRRGEARALAAPPGPGRAKRVLRPLIPTFARRTSAIANESQLAEPEPAARGFALPLPCPAPSPPSQPPTPPPPPLGPARHHATPTRPLPPVHLQFPPSFHHDPPHLLPFLSASFYSLSTLTLRPNSSHDCASDSPLLSLSHSSFPSFSLPLPSLSLSLRPSLLLSPRSRDRVPHRAIRQGTMPEHGTWATGRVKTSLRYNVLRAPRGWRNVLRA